MGIFEKLQEEIKALKNRLDKVEAEKKDLTIAVASLIYKNSVDSGATKPHSGPPPKNDLTKVIHSSQLSEKKKPEPVLQLSQTSITIPNNVYGGEAIKIYVEKIDSGIIVKFVTNTNSN